MQTVTKNIETDYVKISFEWGHSDSSFLKNGQDWHMTMVVKIFP